MIVTYSGADRGRGIERRVRELAGDLESVYESIARCDVVVDALESQQRAACRYRVRLAIAVPGGEIVVSRDPEPDAAQEDALAAVCDSFRAARRRLEAYVWRNLRDEPVAPRSPARPG
jgi:hypothetical protein